MLMSKKPVLGGLAVVLIAGCVAGGLEAAAQSPSAPSSGQAAVASDVIAPSADLTASFPVLAAASGVGASSSAAQEGLKVTKDERLLNSLATPEQQWQVNPSLAVKAGEAGGVSLYLVPGNGRLCLIEEDPSEAAPGGVSTGCDASDLSERLGIFSAGGDMKGPNETVSSTFVRGVLPAGSADASAILQLGQEVPIAIGPDGVFAVNVAGVIASYKFTDSSGTHVAQIGPPPTPNATP